MQNHDLWKVYQRRKSEVASSGGDAYEKLLFHGSSRMGVAGIVQGGFDIGKSQCGSPLIFFASNSSYSHSYSTRWGPGYANGLISSAGQYVMLLCRVATGSPASQQVFTVPHNHQAYPEYILYYTH